MKAISIKQPFIGWILEGKKTLEIRSWQTKIRGDILLCSSKFPKIGELPLGHAVAIAEIVGCRPFMKKDAKLACCGYEPGLYAWELANIRKIKAFPVKGKLGFFHIEFQH
ncbi:MULTISPECIES: ASCH domain-containing protein [Candidatus Brocadia]|uniref:ASCH domain-containing protein n=1 Tax=Candidatus Brocadia TaxID=380240 RepID=UPI0012FF45A2|nr:MULTISPECIES: ASCH domain-containing protein [Brocadia]NOG40471.1 ASCH domain-containing protein [Planctomycetota bacterium]NUO06277.1 ASCH domain-containing protein [Candidatus Brocadia sinica]